VVYRDRVPARRSEASRNRRGKRRPKRTQGAAGARKAGESAPSGRPRRRARRSSGGKRGAARAQGGRALGPRALRTRQRLLDATAELLRERSVLDLSVVEIARKVGSSPATFYHYFRDVEEAALHLAEQAAEEMPQVLEVVDGDWGGDRGLDAARALVDAFMDHWDDHHAVLLVRNLSADKGDRRFQRVRRKALAPVLDRLAELVRQGQEAGRVPPEIQPYAAAAALASILERLSAHYRELAYYEVTREGLAETCARVLHQVITGCETSRRATK
jgi:AcrR family transcriptional regulator